MSSIHSFDIIKKYENDIIIQFSTVILKHCVRWITSEQLMPTQEKLFGPFWFQIASKEVFYTEAKFDQDHTKHSHITTLGHLIWNTTLKHAYLD